MKKELSSIEICFLARELAQLAGSRLDKVYQLGKQKFLFQFQNKKYLVINLPNQAYLASTRPETPEKLGGSAAQLRKKLGTQKLVRIEQVCSERILRLDFGTTKLFIELFGKGNLIADPAYTPPQGIDTFHMVEKEFTKQFLASKENVSKTLAVTFGLGGVYAKEICLRTAVELTAKPDQTNAQKLYAKLQEILKQEIHAHLMYEHDQIKDATPFLLEGYAHLHNHAVSSFSKALEQAFEVKKPAAYEARIARFNTMIAMQEQNLAKLERKAAEEQKKGEYMYEHYQEIKKLLDEIKAAKEKKLSWDEIKKKFKQIKEINKAIGDLVAEFQA